MCCFEKLQQLLSDFGGNSTIEETSVFNTAIILPLPVTKDGRHLNAPFAEKRIILNDDFAKLFCKKIVFCPMKSALIKTSSIWDEKYIYDFTDREEFSVYNALPTAEGAIELAMKEYAATINGSKCLVAGFGRIGKVLAKMLQGLGARVYVSARKKQDLAWIKIFGYTPVDNSNLQDSGEYDLIFNTVPAMIFNAHVLARVAQNAVVIDLASQPGGVDFDSAQRMGINTVHALSLPGKVAPHTSGEIIKNTILNIIEEEIE